MLKTLVTKSLTGKTVTIKYGWVNEEREVWLDGVKVGTKEEKRFRLTVDLEGVGEIRDPQLGRKATDRHRELGVNYRDTHTIEGTAVYQGRVVRVVVQIDDETYETIKAEMDGRGDSEPVEEAETPYTATEENNAEAPVAVMTYGLTAEEYRRERLAFVMSEGYHEDGHESQTFGDWLAYRYQSRVPAYEEAHD